jgi:hypothetical protein
VIVFLIQQLEGAVLVPRVMKNAVGLSPLAVVLAVIIGGALMGILGAVIAIPVAAAVQVLVSHLIALRMNDLDFISNGVPETAGGSSPGEGSPSGTSTQPRRHRFGVERSREA